MVEGVDDCIRIAEEVAQDEDDAPARDALGDFMHDRGGIRLAARLQNRFLTGETTENPINAKGKRVLVIGGGDTGSDCVGTAIRHGAESVTQIEIMPKPPTTRSPSTPWPLWPYEMRTSSSHLEGCERRWSLNSLRFLGTSRITVVGTGAFDNRKMQLIDGRIPDLILIAVDERTDKRPL